MPNYHRHRKKRLSVTSVILILIGAAMVYAGILWAVQLIGNRLEGKEAVEPVGSLEGRFVSDDLTMQYANRVWTYRKRDLTNILFIGVDWEDSKAASERYAGQTDFLFLMTLDRKNKTVSTLQLDRDTMTDIRIYGPFGDYTGTRKMQLCLSHVYGKDAMENCGNTAWAVSRLLNNIPIDACLALDMGGITALNDALGGVTVTLEEDLSKFDAQMTKGATLTLRGKQAEYFVRSRRDVGDGTNVSRMRRQQAFIRAAEGLFIQGMRDKMDYAGTVYDALSGHMTASSDRGWLINKAYECRDYRRLDTKHLAGSHSVSADGFMEFHPDKDALNALITTSFFD